MSTSLPHFILAGLFKDALVITEDRFEQQEPAKKPRQFTNKTSNEESAPPPIPKKWFLGDNKRNVVILLKDEAAVHINDEWLGTLSKLLAACRLNLADVAIVNLKPGITFTLLQEQLQPQHVLMFDVKAEEIGLPFSIPSYQVQKYGGTTFMIAPAVTLSADKTSDAIKAEKRNLWERLKVIFNV
ncbi:hypothetical protein I5907_00675 [Panacibacter sp. DH6]|uniref:Uncharacterized protein n=1 Tax=Panacibacter microcysteis TaxID=2793269 RepID=A0A931E0A9_9BACT|nr:hypothetical protein [Panacibacter microcysteis]MBG9374733.1 hypothetical protein [Panacibacter microcysteis]